MDKELSWEKEIAYLLPEGDIISLDGGIVCSRQALINFIRSLIAKEKMKTVKEVAHHLYLLDAIGELTYQKVITDFKLKEMEGK